MIKSILQLVSAYLADIFLFCIDIYASLQMATFQMIQKQIMTSEDIQTMLCTTRRCPWVSDDPGNLLTVWSGYLSGRLGVFLMNRGRWG